MGKLRLGIVINVLGTAHWGSPYREVTLGLPISTCLHAGLGKYLLCIKGQYLKGLIRKWCEYLEPLLRDSGIISSDLVSKLFGPSAISGSKEVTSVPSLVIIADAYPIKDLRSGKDLFRLGEFSYLIDNSGRVTNARTELVSMVRIDDATCRASAGALFQEVKAVPGTKMYFEVVVKGLSGGEIGDAAKLLLISISQLNYSSIGRALSVGKVYTVGLEPTSLLQDELIRLIMGWLR